MAFKEPGAGQIPYIEGSITAQDWQAFQRSGAPVLMLNSALGWDGTLGDLRKIESLGGRGLHILPLEKGFDVSEMRELKGLSYLYLGRGCKGVFEVARHPSLAELRNLAETKDLKASLDGADHLVKLVCNGGHLKDPRVLLQLSSLNSLSVMRPAFDPSKVPAGLGIEEVDFYAWTKLTSCKVFTSFALRKLSLSACKHLRDYSALSELDRLESIFLDDCSPVPSAEVLAGLGNLRKIVFQGTEFVESDISSLRRLNLVEIELSQPDRYSPRPEDLLA